MTQDEAKEHLESLPAHYCECGKMMTPEVGEDWRYADRYGVYHSCYPCICKQLRSSAPLPTGAP